MPDALPAVMVPFALTHWLQRGQRFQCRVGARMFVFVDDNGRPFARRDGDRNNLLREDAAPQRSRGPLLAAVGEGILILRARC